MVVNGHHDVSLQAELAAMQHIAEVLDSLAPPARARVMQWAVQRIRDAAPTTPPVAPRPLVVTPKPGVEPIVPDEALSVTALEELFHESPEEPAAREAAPQPVTGLLQDLIVEFQSIARDWNVACAELADRNADQRSSSAA